MLPQIFQSQTTKCAYKNIADMIKLPVFYYFNLTNNSNVLGLVNILKSSIDIDVDHILQKLIT